jgi:hypothetical protein
LKRLAFAIASRKNRLGLYSVSCIGPLGCALSPSPKSKMAFGQHREPPTGDLEPIGTAKLCGARWSFDAKLSVIFAAYLDREGSRSTKTAALSSRYNNFHSLDEASAALIALVSGTNITEIRCVRKTSCQPGRASTTVK